MSVQTRNPALIRAIRLRDVRIRRFSMELETVREDRHGGQAGRGAGGPDQEVRAAGLDDAIGGAEVRLGLHVVGVGADRPAARIPACRARGPRGPARLARPLYSIRRNASTKRASSSLSNVALIVSPPRLGTSSSSSLWARIRSSMIAVSLDVSAISRLRR